VNPGRPFVVLPFPERGQAGVSTRKTTRSTNGQIVGAVARRVVKRDRIVRFFQDIHGLVHGRPHPARQFVACASGRGVPANQVPANQIPVNQIVW
jgi:hypothetical protein